MRRKDRSAHGRTRPEHHQRPLALAGGLDQRQPIIFMCGCKLDLIYAPTVITASSTLALAYRYIDSAGNAQTATTGIAYAGNEASLFASALIS
jgi:hypothetical protein